VVRGLKISLYLGLCRCRADGIFVLEHIEFPWSGGWLG
jgi:hypothetical protein